MMGGYGDVQLLNDDGSRLDGRKVDEMREVTIEAGVLPAADGSAMVTHGLNVAVAAVYGPMEAHPGKSNDKTEPSSTCATTWHRSRPRTAFALDLIAALVRFPRSGRSARIRCFGRTLSSLENSR